MNLQAHCCFSLSLLRSRTLFLRTTSCVMMQFFLPVSAALVIKEKFLHAHLIAFQMIHRHFNKVIDNLMALFWK